MLNWMWIVRMLINGTSINPRLYTHTHIFFLFFWTGFIIQTGWGSVLLGCCLPHGCKDIAQLLSLPLGSNVCPHPFLDEFQGPLVLRDLEQLHGAPLIGGKATHLSDHVPNELGVLGEAPAAAAVPRLAHVLGHLVALVEAHGHGVAQSHGCCSSMAVVLQWLPWQNPRLYF